MTTDQTEAAAVAVPLDAPVRPWERCKDHGPAQPRVWACPACLVELREENQRLRMDLENTRAEAVLAVATERKRWRTATEYAAHQLEKARIWSGMGWHYNPLHPLHYRSALERLRDVLRA